MRARRRRRFWSRWRGVVCITADNTRVSTEHVIGIGVPYITAGASNTAVLSYGFLSITAGAAIITIQQHFCQDVFHAARDRNLSTTGIR